LTLRPAHAALIPLVSMLAALPAAAEPYLLLGGSFSFDSASTFEDADCAPSGVAAFYGCGYSTDGDFAGGAMLEAGAGWHFGHGLRLSATIGFLPSMDYSGHSNFLQGTSFEGTPEDVDGTVESWTLFADAALDLAEMAGWSDLPVRPYVTAGAGVAWNHLDPMVFRFPALDQTTTTPGGDTTSFAWRAGIGLTIPLDDAVAIDIAWRYLDLGTVETGRGDITVERHGTTSRVEVGATRADLAVQTVGVSLRWAF
jgi:opacity protein-like surface antigen